MQLIRMQRLQARDKHYLTIRKRILEGLGVPEDIPNDQAEKLVKALERRYAANQEGEIITQEELFESSEDDEDEDITSEMDFFDQLDVI